MKKTSRKTPGKSTLPVVLTVIAVMAVIMSVSSWVCYKALQAEAFARYVGIRNVSAEKVAKIIRGAEMNAQNIFDEVSQSLDTPEHVISALERKAGLNLEVRGYFAAFELNYFPEMGTWFEPYIYQPDVTGFEYKQVGSARHNYTKSPWYIRAKDTDAMFWSDPYYYYDGTRMIGHYCTFIKPIRNADGKLACVCGADMKFEWLSKELSWVDDISRQNNLLNRYHLLKNFDFYSIILDANGSCIAHPEEKTFSITDKGVINDLAMKKGGVIDMEVDGVPCTIYYGPVEYVNWGIAIVVPRHDILMPLLPVGILFLTITVIGIIIVWRVTRRAFREKPETTDTKQSPETPTDEQNPENPNTEK